MENFYVLILAGGKGKRLWPKSKTKFPKHTLCFNSDSSLLQKTFLRLQGFIPEKDIFVVTTEVQKRIVKRALPFLREENLILEPEGKNTLACIILGAILIKRISSKAIMAVLPSDHLIEPRRKFLSSLKKAKDFLEENSGIVILGIKPKYPETGYGYIKIKSKISRGFIRNFDRDKKIYKIETFIEKPVLEKAKRFLKEKDYFWNSGIFIFKVNELLEETRRLVPSIFNKFSRLLENRERIRSLLKNIYKKIPSLSFDNGILEKSKSLYMLEADFSWLDLGSWESLASIFKKDKFGNVNKGKNFLYQTKKSIIFNEEENHLVATLGLDNLVIINTPQVTLIYPKQRSQELKNLVNLLQKDKRFRKYL